MARQDFIFPYTYSKYIHAHFLCKVFRFQPDSIPHITCLPPRVNVVPVSTVWQVDAAVRKETKYLCSARLSSHHTLWQHQRKQRRIKLPQQAAAAAPAQPHPGSQSADDPGVERLEAMAKFSEVNGAGAEANSRDHGDEGLSLAESFLLGKLD